MIQPYIFLHSFFHLTYSATLYKLLHILLQLWLVIILSNQSYGFISAKMFNQSSTMIFLDKILSHWTFGNTQLASFEQHNILDHEIQLLFVVKCNRFYTSLPHFTKISIIWIQSTEFLESNHLYLHLCQ